MINLLLVQSVYTDFYGVTTKSIIGIFSDNEKVETAIKNYKDEMKKYDCENLLESTRFAIDEYVLDRNRYGE